MKLIRPITMNDANLVSSSVAENDYPAWAIGSTYSQGSRCIWVSDDRHRVYESRSDANVGNHPEVVSTSLVLPVTGSRQFVVPTALSFTGGEDIEIVSLSDPTVTLTGTVSTYNSSTGLLVLNITEVTGGGLQSAWLIKRTGLWLEIGATNRWRMFDESITSQTAAADLIDVVLTSTERVDSVALMNIEAETVQIIMTDPSEGVVYDKTVKLVSTEGITEWYAWFFEPIQRKPDIVFDDLPPYANAQVRIILQNSGNDVLCGVCILGRSRFIGSTQYGASLGIQDYSVKSRDEFGNWGIRQRSFSKRGRFSLVINNNQVDAIHTLLSGYRATPIIYIGSGSLASSLIYGYYKDFTTVIEYATTSICDIELEGLT